MSYSHIFALDLYCLLDKKKALGKTAVALEQKKLAAHTENELGVQCFSKNQSREAIQHFTSAIELDSTNSFFYSNRSNSYQQIESWKCAIADARKVSITSLSHNLCLILCLFQLPFLLFGYSVSQSQSSILFIIPVSLCCFSLNVTIILSYFMLYYLFQYFNTSNASFFYTMFLFELCCSSLNVSICHSQTFCACLSHSVILSFYLFLTYSSLTVRVSHIRSLSSHPHIRKVTIFSLDLW